MEYCCASPISVPIFSSAAVSWRGDLPLGGGAVLGELLLGVGPPLVDLPLHVDAQLGQLLLALRARRLDLLLDLGTRRLGERLRGGPGLLGLLRGQLADPRRLLLGVRVRGLALGAQLRDQLLDVGELGLGGRAALLVELVLLGAARRQLLLQLLQDGGGMLACLGADAFRLVAAAPRPAARRPR